jgi:hypothetical protein
VNTDVHVRKDDPRTYADARGRQQPQPCLIRVFPRIVALGAGRRLPYHDGTCGERQP